LFDNVKRYTGLLQGEALCNDDL